MNNEFLIFSKIPGSFDLCYFIGQLDPTESRDESVPSDFQWQILKTRYLIWKRSEIIAAPFQQMWNQIHVICSKEFVKSGDLRKVEEEHRISFNGPFDVNNFIYQECLKYSLSFKLAPNWNKVSDVYIQSCDFLTSCHPMNAIKLDLSTRGNELTLMIKPLRVTLPLLNLVHLGVDLNVLKEKGKVQLLSTVYILPQLKQATAVAVSTSLPTSSPFKEYTQLRKHWKNIHGYRLPHTEDGMLFLEVHFHRNRMLYTYPIICTRSSQLYKLKNLNDGETINSFTNQLMKKLPAVCGTPLDLKFNRDDLLLSDVCLYPAQLIPTQPNSRLKSSITQDTTQPFSLAVLSDESSIKDIGDKKRSKSPPLFLPSLPQKITPTSFGVNSDKFKPVFQVQSCKENTQVSQLKSVKKPTVAKKNTNVEHENTKIETLAKCFQLNKLKMIDLLDFCVKQNIHVKNKEKKKDIVTSKIYKHFGVFNSSM